MQRRRNGFHLRGGGGGAIVVFSSVQTRQIKHDRTATAVGWEDIYS